MGHMRKWEVHTEFYLGHQKGRDHFGDLGSDRRIILKWILQKEDVRVWTKFIWLLGPSGGFLKCGNEQFDYMKGWDQLGDYQNFNNKSAP
jgi:hypothetical protein